MIGSLYVVCGKHLCIGGFAFDFGNLLMFLGSTLNRRSVFISNDRLTITYSSGFLEQALNKGLLRKC